MGRLDRGDRVERGRARAGRVSIARPWAGPRLAPRDIAASVGTIAAAALAVAVLTAGDMTVTDLLQIRTYAEEVYLQYSLGRGPGAAAAVAVPPLLVLGVLIVSTARGLGDLDPARVVSSFQRAKPWPLGRWRVPCGVVLMGLFGNAVALPIYSLVWRAGRVGGRATLGQPPVWSTSGLLGTLRYAGDEIWEPLKASLVWTAVAATLTALLGRAHWRGPAAGRWPGGSSPWACWP